MLGLTHHMNGLSVSAADLRLLAGYVAEIAHQLILHEYPRSTDFGPRESPKVR